MKVIEFNTPNGVYQVPLKLIAENRADYYSTVRSFNENSERYQEEIDFVMNDDYEGIDWLINNMNYEDIEDDTIKINNEVNVIDEDFWTSSDDFEIIDEE
jgi:hypothetical protein